MTLDSVLVGKHSKGFPKDQFCKYRVETDSTGLLRSSRSLKITFFPIKYF
jgi:hypothetical protein